MIKRKVCFFGIYDPGYSRNSVLIKGFEDNGYEIIHCRVDASIGLILKYIKLFKEYNKIKSENFDFVFVATPGHSVVWFAKILFNKKIIFDAFVSLYSSNVEDRKKYKKNTIWSAYDSFLDWFSCYISDVVILDTIRHIDYFVNRYGLSKSKFLRVFVGSNDEIVFPMEGSKNGSFIVHFHGTNIPLQGVEYILESAEIIYKKDKDVVFFIYGIKGNSVNNVKFFPRFSYNKMSKVISNSDIVLGIFGKTLKAQNVIPNKVFEGLAARKAVITSKTPAIKELLEDKHTVLLCEGGNAFDLSEKILLLKNNNDLRQKIAYSGFLLFKSKLTPKNIISVFLKEYESIYF